MAGVQCPVMAGATASTLSITETGAYKVGASYGECSFESEISVTIEACELPQGISPNGDGLNDSFDLSNLNVESVEIFNRNGRMIYKKNGGYSDQWHGQTDDGDELLTGTYYYVIQLEEGKKFKGKQVLTGWVYINQQIN